MVESQMVPMVMSIDYAGDAVKKSGQVCRVVKLVLLLRLALKIVAEVYKDSCSGSRLYLCDASAYLIGSSMD
jgi:hypothetical protein